MRITLTIPNEYHKQVKDSLDKKGFQTINDYFLSLIRTDQHHIDAPEIKMIKQSHHIDAESHEIPSTPTTNHKVDKSLSGRSATCPICYEITPVEHAQQHYQKSHGDI